MTTAFQPDLFQSDAFQIAGGVAATDFQVSIALTQESDSFGLNLSLGQISRGAGKSRKRQRYIARYKGEDYEFSSIAELEQFVDDKREEQAAKPKKARAPVKITLAPDFIEEIAPVIEYPRRLEHMPTSAAMAQIRRIDNTLAKLLADAQRAADEEDEELCLMCIM